MSSFKRKITGFFTPVDATWTFFVDVKDEGLAGRGMAGHGVARQVLGGTFIDLKFVLDAFFFLSVLVDCRISGKFFLGGEEGEESKENVSYMKN